VGSRQIKFCTVCGRQIEWRKKWRRSWDQVKYCSNACRKSGLKATDRELESATLGLLSSRGAGKTICPSEAAQKVSKTLSKTEWKSLVPATRNAARRLYAKGRVDILQGGHPVDPSTTRGPIRIRLRKNI